MWLMLALALWSASSALVSLMSQAAPLYALTSVQSLGACSAATLWFLFGWTYTGWQTPAPRILLLLGIGPLVGIALAWSSSSAMLPWYLIAYNLPFLLSGSALLVNALTQRTLPNRQFHSLLLISALVPVIGSIIDLSNFAPVPRGVCSALALSIAGLGWAKAYYQLPAAERNSPILTIEHIRDAAFVLDTQQRVVTLNSAARQLLEQPAVNPLGQPISELLAHRPNLASALAQIADTPQHLAISEPPDHFELQIAPLDAQRDHEHLVVLHNISELQQAKVAADRIKSSFLANIGHEMRTPLTTIIGYSDVVLHDLAAKNERELMQDMEQIKQAGRYLHQLVENLLDLANIEAGTIQITPQLFACTPLVDDVVEIARPMMRKHNNQLIVSSSATSDIVEADPIRVRQVLLNLLSNAAKFTTNGTVSLTIRQGDPPQSAQEQPNAPHPGFLAIDICDTGIGIAPEQLEQLFQPFTQNDMSVKRAYGGAGIGLALSRRICHLMGGKLTATSRLGHGSTFTVYLPTPREPATEQQSA